MKRSPNRWLLKLALFVLIGAIVNVVVAWGLVALTSADDEYMLDENLFNWDRFVERLPIADRPQIHWVNFEVHYFSSTGVRHAATSAAFHETEESLSKFKIHELMTDGGWPAPALRGCVWSGLDGADVYEWSFASPHEKLDWLETAWFGRRPIPLLPIFPGFAINTILYAAILWLLLAAPGAICRSLRRRRGQCPACAYPVGTSATCTECGAAIIQYRTR